MPSMSQAAARAAADDVSPLASVRALFYVTAEADPGLLPRLIEPVAKLGHVPLRVHASREAGDGTRMTVDLRLAGLAPEGADRVRRALMSVIGVEQVLASVETEADEAACAQEPRLRS